MLTQIGARLQESLREHPALERTRNFNRMLKGVILSVNWRDLNQSQQTLVDIALYGGYPNIYNVPVSAEKFNQGNGEEWTPEPGDMVLVTFIDGNWSEPIVLRQLHLPQEDSGIAIQADARTVPSGKRRYHLRCNKTDIVIDKDGNRTTSVEVDETLTVKGKRTTTITGNESVTVNTGDITITATAGKCTVTIKGKTAWRSDGTIELDGTAGTGVKGVVQGDCICALTGKPHIHISASVKGSK